jgi:hypothetical protein
MRSTPFSHGSPDGAGVFGDLSVDPRKEARTSGPFS